MRPLLLLLFLAAATLLGGAGPASSQERFPPPEFESGHALPETTSPPPDSALIEYADVLLLALALGAAAWAVFRLRSRRAVKWISVIALVYFGFWREGCVCPIGSIQNVALALFEPGYAVPLPVLLFFVLPLVAALFFGRSFCAAVCPQGVLQDLVLVRALTVPAWLEQALGLLPHVYLGLAVLFAATGSAFVICEDDPFVPFFRLSAPSDMFLLGGCFLLVGLFVGRPYCRFLCPYGALLGLLARLTRYRVRITPEPCVDCRLCERACPFGAIELPSERRIGEPEQGRRIPRERTHAALAFVLLLLLPAWALGSGFLTSRLAGTFALGNATVALVERLRLEEKGEVEGTTDASEAFRESGLPRADLEAEAAAIRDRFHLGSWALGVFVGLVLGLKLVAISLGGRRTEDEANRALCQGCARCFDYCPQNDPRTVWYPEGEEPARE